jgi:hypothetical protein
LTAHEAHKRLTKNSTPEQTLSPISTLGDSSWAIKGNQPSGNQPSGNRSDHPPLGVFTAGLSARVETTARTFGDDGKPLAGAR